MSRQYDARNWTLHEKLDAILENVDQAALKLQLKDLYIKELEDAILDVAVQIHETSDYDIYETCRFCKVQGADLEIDSHRASCLYRRIKEFREEGTLIKFLMTVQKGQKDGI